MPEAVVYTYPVATTELRAGRWWTTQESAERLATEYAKYLVVLTREAARRVAPGKPAPPGRAASPAPA